MRQLFRKRSGKFFVLLLMIMCVYSLSTSGETLSKKKRKNEKKNEVKQVIQEDYGNTVTLVTSGSGATEDEATKNALQNAIEQAYGTFVSSNTTVINDESFSDAITSVSSGNVLSYEQISSISTSEGFMVSVNAIVSIGNLITFATSRGMTAELAGNTFLMNRNLARLNKRNERIALKNLADQLFLIVVKGMYDYTIDVAQLRTNDAMYGSPAYAIDVKVNATPNANYELFWETIDRTLSCLSVSPTESANLKSLEMETYGYSYSPSFNGFELLSGTNFVGTKSKYILRNNIGYTPYGEPFSDEKTEIFLLELIGEYVEIGKFGYELYDNLGNTIIPTFYVFDKTSADFRYKYGIEGSRANRIHGTNFCVILKESSTSTQYRISRPSEVGERGMIHRSFVMQYNESELSKLRNVSVRPHSITFVDKFDD